MIPHNSANVGYEFNISRLTKRSFSFVVRGQFLPRDALH